MFAVTNACALLGTEAVPVRVEAHVDSGLPRFTIVGLRTADAGESRERIRCGLQAIGLTLPSRRVTINIAPADLPKAGAAFDLPILLALLAAMEVVPAAAVATVGSQAEVGLDGTLREVLGAMAGALTAARSEWAAFVVAAAAAGRAAHASVPVLGARTLGEVVSHLRGTEPLAPADPARHEPCNAATHPDLCDVRGQQHAVRALEIAAAGGHNLLMCGPPGCGKTMLAHRLPSILPGLDGDEALEVATIHDAAGTAPDGVATARPFRAPHHAVTQPALIGGGSQRAMVGELSLAHRGVLFLDELPEFRPSVLDGMRQPLEERQVTVRRARWMVRYPCETQVVAAMNLCRCGRLGARGGLACGCSEQLIASYRARVSGAILDRFDMQVALDAPEGSVLDLPPAPTSAEMRERVQAAWQRQFHRWGRRVRNGHVRVLGTSTLLVDRPARELVDRLVTALALGGRAQGALVRVARTIADLEGREVVGERDVALAQGYAVRGWQGNG